MGLELEGGLPLFTESPRREILGNSVSCYRGSRKLTVALLLRYSLGVAG